MNKKIVTGSLIAIALYGLFVILVILFYDDSPDKMDWEDREVYNRQFIATLELEQFTLEQAITELGSPDITEAKKVVNDKFQVVFYRTQHVKSDGITTQDECTFLLFVNGILEEIGLGKNYPENWGVIKNYQLTTDKEPLNK